jgi:two-component system KDP operon response regulator KdpE
MVTPSAALILVVDDDRAILNLVRIELADQEFRVVTAESGEQALLVFEEQHPDLVVLDVGLPDMSGLDVMHRLRLQSTVPVILLTGRAADADKVRGLQQGADDYVAKPFSPEELGARVRAVLRRERHGFVPTEPVVKVRGLVIDLERRVVTHDGEIVALTRTEWNLLHHLVSNAGKVIVSSQILSKVWGPEYRDDLQYLRVWIARLRKKLEPDRPERSMIRTMPRIGYMFDPTVADEPQ